jgi:8-amino-7-oxononanoate synthase
MTNRASDPISRRIAAVQERLQQLTEAGLYFYNQPVSELKGGSRVMVGGREMGMYASYSYLGLLGHPRIAAAAKQAIEKFGTGTHGVRLLAGTLTLHRELEESIAAFKEAEDAITFSSGYVTNLAVVSTLLGRRDVVIGDKLNHASIVDGCLQSGARFWRFRHNDPKDLERLLRRAPGSASKLVVVDAVFSMDGDIVDLPAIVALCRRYEAWLMVDEAHSLGVLGPRGRGIEEHFGLKDTIDLKMGTFSKAIPSVGGYVAGRREVISFLRHSARPYIFSAALPPAQAAAAKEALALIVEEPERVEKLQRNAQMFLSGLRSAGFDTMLSRTAIVPILCGQDHRAFQMTRACQELGLFVLPVVSPAVPEGTARLRATVTAAHEPSEIEQAVELLARAGHSVGVLR